MSCLNLLFACALILSALHENISLAQSHPASLENLMQMYIGTYTGPQSKGIYLVSLDPQTGQFGKPTLAGEAKNPSFLGLHPNGRFLYATSEIGDFNGKKTGAVAAFAIDPATLQLTLLNLQPSGGGGPCYVRVDPSGKFALVANYGQGSVSSLPIQDDGSLSELASNVQHEGKSVDPKRQKKPYAHSINPDPTGRFALACDLGVDKVFVYRIGPTGKLDVNDPPSGSVPPGGGPRHLTFDPAGKFVYVINEMGNTITAFAWDAAQGALTEVQTIGTLPDGFNGENSTAEVAMHPSGKFLYGSNRGHDSIAVFSIDTATGKLTAKGHTSTHGKNPRHFAVDLTGRFLIAANQDSNNLVAFWIDAQTGELSPTGSTVQVQSPVCVRFVGKK
jgi:6-phosphogluconolactonase